MSARTFLFAPGSDLAKVDKALASAADIVIIDLEDAVAPQEKERARANVVEVLRAKPTKSVLVRVNSLSTAWALPDLLAIVPLLPHGIVIPKAQSNIEIKIVSWVIEQLAGVNSGIDIYPLIETATGVEKATSIAKASARVKRLIFGALDYSLDLGLSYSGDPTVLAYARARLVVASAAAGLEGPIDTVYPGFKDEDGLRRDTLEAKKLGFKGKLVIHPAQIIPVNEVFTPSEVEFEEAHQIVEVYRQAQAEGKGAVQWKGKMIDEPVLKRAEQILAVKQRMG